MCGISGIINFNQKINSKEVNKMNLATRHRGPDDEKIVDLKFSSLGILRLSIVDLTEMSNQPFCDKDREIIVTYNGEIYNFKELKNKYFKNTIFKSKGDGEIILHLYKKFGIHFVNLINGMFSICIVDEKFDKIFLVRDRFGIKPLYYYHDQKEGNLIFCSEIKGIVNTSLYKKEMNLREAKIYLKKGFINSTSETWFKDIYQVQAGTYISFDRNKLKKNKYYLLEEKINEDLDNNNITFNETLNNIKEKMLSSYDEHKNFDVKGGLHVSGGTDSAIISALAKIFKLNKHLNTYTFTFENEKFSELEDAKLIANSCNLSSKSSLLKDDKVENYLYKVLDAEFEPFSSLRVLSQHHLYETYKKDIRVVIDGSGGDEIGAGYVYYALPWYFDILNDQKVSREKDRFYKLANYAKNETVSLQQFITGSVNQTFSPGSSTVDGSIHSGNDLLNPELNKNAETENFKMKKPFKSYLRNAQYADLYHLKLPRALRYVDRASMSNSIEARVPLLDHNLVEACFQAPSRFKIVNNQQRALFKYNFKGQINKKVLFKNKRTIADPQSFWLKNNLKNLTQDIFYDKEFNKHNFLDKKKFLKYYENFLNYPKHFNTFFIFQVLIMELWINNILKKN